MIAKRFAPFLPFLTGSGRVGPRRRRLLKFNGVLRRLVWANILIAGSAAGWVVVALHALGLAFDGALAGLAFFLTLAFYTRDRLDMQEHSADRLAMPQRTAWVRRNEKHLRRVVWGGFACAVLLAAFRPGAMLPLLAGLGFALSYTRRWLPWRGERRGWKHLPGLKMPFVALLWTLTTVITPAAVHRQLGRPTTWLLAAAVCVLVMVQILLNDLRDIGGDRAGGTLSLPVLAGEAKARRVGYVLSLAGLGLGLGLKSVSIAFAALYTLGLVGGYRRRHDARWRGWIEAQGIVAALATVVPF